MRRSRCRLCGCGGVRFGVSRWLRLGGARRPRGARFGGHGSPGGHGSGCLGGPAVPGLGSPRCPQGPSARSDRAEALPSCKMPKYGHFAQFRESLLGQCHHSGSPGCGVSPRRGKRRVKLYCCCSGRTCTNRERGFMPGGRPQTRFGDRQRPRAPGGAVGRGPPGSCPPGESNLRVSPMLPGDNLVSAMVERSGLVSRQQSEGS